jgi:hypothetical protein
VCFTFSCDTVKRHRRHLYVAASTFKNRVDIDIALLHVFSVGYEVFRVRKYRTRYSGWYLLGVRQQKKIPLSFLESPLL